MKRFRLAGGDGAFYGAAFGPVYAEEKGLVSDSGREFLLLKLESPIVADDGRIEYVLVSPRYVGDTLEKLKRSECVVAVWRVRSDKKRTPAKELFRKNSEYWSVGTSRPCKG